MKKVLITGASSGIGKELAYLLAEKGIELILHGRDAVSLITLSNELAKKTKVVICKADLRSFDGVQVLLKTIQKEFPDTVINNAGVGLYGDFISHGPQEMQEMIAVNCAAVVSVSQHIAFWWQQEGVKGTILNVSSALSFTPAPGACVYGATKAFITNFSQAFDVEMEPHGIRVLCACPGRVATNFAERASKGKSIVKVAKGMVLSAGTVAKAIIEQLESKKALFVIDWKYRLLVWVQRVLPLRVVSKRMYRTLKARVEESLS